MTKNPIDDTVTDYASISSQYGYVTANGVTTNLISSVNNTVTGSEGTSTVNYGYTYDGNGKITGITAVSNVTGLSSASQYIYDEAGQLVKEIKGSDYTEYAYDSKGNISTRKVYSNNTLVSTDNFTYGSEAWEDRLTGYNDKTVTYDSIGNPTSYLGATLTWRGRELESYAKGNIQFSYSYDVDGMRYRKVVKTDGVETARYDYVYSEGSLILITYTADGVSDTARFIYDSYGEPRGFILNDTAAYLYLKNAQGDITGIVNENGAVILTYAYTAWGEITYSATSMQNMLLAAMLSNVNPFTYRGYCYDYDIGMYYLQSRYYDPEIGRFINADSTDYLGVSGGFISFNLFAYCENDPVNYFDENGHAKKQTVKIYKGFAGWGDPFVGDDKFVYNSKVKATKKDSENWKVWGTLQKVASICYPEGAAFYEYYRSNKGGYYLYDYGKAYKQDIKIRNAVKEAVKELKRKAPLFKVKDDELYYIYTSLVSVKPISMNWLLALGGHHFVITAMVVHDSKNKLYVMRYFVVAIDRYNFDDNGKNFFGIPDALNGRFVTLGWAKFFTSYGFTEGACVWKG